MLALSIGRSGSPFLAKAFSENTDYVKRGRERVFGQELVKKPRCEHPAEISHFMARKLLDGTLFLDKTQELYRYIDLVNFGPDRVDYSEVVRARCHAVISCRRCISRNAASFGSRSAGRTMLRADPFRSCSTCISCFRSSGS